MEGEGTPLRGASERLSPLSIAHSLNDGGWKVPSSTP